MNQWRLPNPANPLYRLTAPHLIALWLFLPLLLAYELISRSAFISLWRSPKIGSIEQALYFSLCIASFAFGSWAASHSELKRLQKPVSSEMTVPIWYVRIGMWLTLAAYAIWFGLAVFRASGVGELLDIRRTNPYYVKQVLMGTIPGVTTLTQVAVAAIPLLVVTKVENRSDIGMALFISLLALARAYLFSERLAFLEIAVPALYLMASNRRMNSRGVIISGLLAAIAMVLYFTISELSRSFLARDIRDTQELVLEAAIRLVGYYMTSINNANMLMQYFSFGFPFYSTLQFLWRFPGLTGIFERMFGPSIYMPTELIVRGLNPEFNTVSAIGAWVADFGFLTAWLFAAMFGFLTGSAWKMAPHSPMFAALNSVWLVGLLEFIRIQYFTSTRLFPAYAVFLGAVVIVGLRRRNWSMNLALR